MIGHVVGNYRILAEIGRGGMGMVYRAEHVQLGRPAALKMLLPQLSSDAAIVQRFFNEARAASAIDHPGIVEIYDFGRHTDGSAYIVMSLLRGESLQQRMRRGPIAPNEASTIVAQVASALAAAHALGIVHRDLKPDNIFLVPNEMMPFGIQPKLLDFGIAKLAGDHHGDHRTQTGVMLGTPAYMSPEQCMGRSDLDHRTDLYSLGCILFHLLGGRPPFTSEHGTGMIIAAHLRDEPPDLRTLNPAVPVPLVAIVKRLLEKDPAARFGSALELRDALVGAGADAPRTRPPAPSAHADQYSATMMAPTGPGATGATQATGVTTRSGSAAQMLAPPTAAPRSNKGALIGVAAIAIAGAAIGAVVMSSSNNESAPVAAGSPNETSEPGAPPATPTPGSAAPTSPVGSAVALAACPPGQSRRDDTNGQCCWPGQAYSTAKSRCVGAPMCPPGQIEKDEGCVDPPPPTVLAEAPMPAGPAAPVKDVKDANAKDAKPVPGAPPHPDHARPHPDHVKRPPPPDDPPKTGTVEAPPFTLNAKAFAPGEPIQVAFAKPVLSTRDRRAWITIVEASAAPADYGAWAFVEDGARAMTFKAPDKDGVYEVRLHANYPQKSHDLKRRVKIVVGGGQAVALATETPRAQQRFVAATIAKVNDKVELYFPKPMVPKKGERFWVTVVERDAPDTKYGAWTYVTDGAKSAQLTMPATAGDYQLRLHANYPAKSTNVVFRSEITVDP